jgi:gas vesicle protein
MVWPSPVDVRIVGSLPTDWLNIGFTGGAVIVGAIIGALVSWLVARVTAKENRESARTALRNQEETATLRAITKVMELVNAAAGYHFQIEREVAEAKQQFPDKELETWQTMVPRVGRPHEVHISADDLIAFTKARNFEYVTDLLHLVSQYNSMIYGFQEYSKRRDDLTAMLTPDTINGALGSGDFDPAQMLKVQPYLIGVRRVADQLREEAKEIYEAGVSLCPRFRDTVRAYFDDPKFPYPGTPAEPKAM